MRGLGTIVNVAAIILGGLIGLWIKGGLKEKTQNIMTKGSGLAVIFIGASGTLSVMLTVKDGVISAGGSMLLIVSMVIGGIVGTVLKIQDGLGNVGNKLEKLFKSKENNRFAEGFVSATLVTCVGSMSIVGSIQDGISGDASILYVKALLDFFTVMIFAASTGVGAVFSAVPTGVYQGLITVAALFISPYMSDTLIANLNMVGSALITAIGINLSFGEKYRVGDYLPALLVPVGYEIITRLI